MNALPGLGRFPAADVAAPRFREAGDLTLDRTHHDGRVEDRWLGLTMREFAILWRLAECPGVVVTVAELTADLWRVRFGCDAGDLPGHVTRLAVKLAAEGLAGLLVAGSEGGYRLAAGATPGDLSRPLARGH